MRAESIAILALAVGALVLLAAWLPLLTRRLPLSLPIIAVGLGYLVGHFSWPDETLGVKIRLETLEHLSEFVILVALMGLGLRIERPFIWGRWQTPYRLLSIAMILTIFGMASICWAILGLGWASALLIGAALAPTDPVLAADVQVGPPGEDEGGEVRFGLTSEAGLNDGFAFPFVLLAMGLSSRTFAAQWQHWLFVDVLWRIACGAGVGFLAGWAFGWLTFKLPRLKLSKTGDGLAAVGVALISYGITELANGYGFIAVFISAMTLRASDRGSDFHAAMAEFSEQIERVLMVLVMVVFGGALASGILDDLGWKDMAVGTALLLVVRPVSAWISLLWSPLPIGARALISFFGIRGLGTFYYMSYATSRVHFPDSHRLWAIASFVVVCSVVLHGISSTPLMNWADRRRRARAKSPVPALMGSH